MARRLGTMQAQSTSDYERLARERATLERDLARIGQPTKRRRRPTQGRGIKGFIAGLITGAFEPGELGSGELTPEQQKEVDDKVKAIEQKRQEQIDSLIIEPMPNRYGHVPRVGDVGPANREVLNRARWPSPLPFPSMPAPSPATAPTPRSSRAARVLHRIQSMTGNRYAQLGILGLTALGRRDDRSSALPSAVVDTPLAPPLPVPQVTAGMIPLTAFGGSLIPSTPTATRTDNCDCKPKKRGPRRECLERAPIKWSGGRRKGKAAGTKCVRWRN
jgi:hypothetical protein